MTNTVRGGLSMVTFRMMKETADQRVSYPATISRLACLPEEAKKGIGSDSE